MHTDVHTLEHRSIISITCKGSQNTWNKCINTVFVWSSVLWMRKKQGLGVTTEKQKKISSTAWTYLIPCWGEDCKSHFQGFNSSLESSPPLGPLRVFAQMCLLRTLPCALDPPTCFPPHVLLKASPSLTGLPPLCEKAKVCRVNKKSFMLKGTWFVSPLWMQKIWLQIWYFVRFFLRCSRMFPESCNSFTIVNWIT